VAGRFYPRDPSTLAATVDRLLDAVEVPDGEPLAPAYVVPHAGYVYSGPTAAHVYARLRRHAEQVERVVLLGPAHFVRLDGCAVPASTAWATPLGELPIDEVGEIPAQVDDAPHAPEHSLEVQLPFLQRALGRPVPILPIAVGTAPTETVAAALTVAAAKPTASLPSATLASRSGSSALDRSDACDPGTLVLCSTDLSHYLDQAAAVARDTATAAAIGALTPERIGRADACGAFALRGLLTWARTGALRPELLLLATSADTAGDPFRVVGYGAFGFHLSRAVS
jgi:AmmeMemoRadiSam system protein B